MAEGQRDEAVYEAYLSSPDTVVDSESLSGRKESSPSSSLRDTLVDGGIYADEPVYKPHRHEPKNLGDRIIEAVLPHGGMLSSMFNLASATLGASIISLPAAFKLCGISVATVFLVACTIATVYSIYLLMETHRRTGLRSYEEMARVLLGHKLDYVTAVLMFLFCFGTAVAYVIALGDLFKPFQVGNDGLPAAFQGVAGNRFMVSIVWFFFMLPLALPKEINSLRYVSFFGVCAIFYFVGIMVYHSSTHGIPEGVVDTLDWARGGNESIVGLSLIMFAFLCQVNAFEIYCEMRVQTVMQMTKTAGFSMSGCLVLYIIAGFFGYADFGRTVHGAVLEDFHPRRNKAIAVSYACLVVKLCAAFALCIQPSRDSLFYVLNWGDYHHVTVLRRVLLCGAMAVGALILGLYIPSLEVVFGLLGSLCGGLLGFIFPALFIMYAGGWSYASVGPVHFWSTWLLLVSGVAAAVFGTAASVYGLFNAY